MLSILYIDVFMSLLAVLHVRHVLFVFIKCFSYIVSISFHQYANFSTSARPKHFFFLHFFEFDSLLENTQKNRWMEMHLLQI